MPSRIAQPKNRFGEKLADFTHRRCLWLLIACYALAFAWPVPGRLMRLWIWRPDSFSHATVTLPMLLLATLLFCAALTTDVSQLRSIVTRPWALGAGLVGVWLAPALLVVIAAAVVPRVFDGAGSTELLVGLVLVAAMPVANSSVGWTQLVDGNLALSLGLVLLTILVCPWVTPWLVDELRNVLAPAEQGPLDALIRNLSGRFLIAWVILPTAAGLLCRYLFDEQRVVAARRWISLMSVVALLGLNYINAALAFPEVLQHSRTSLLAAAAFFAIAMSAVGMAAGWGMARLMRLPVDAQFALVFGLGMKHTGLALLLAGTVLAEQGLTILMIVLATLAQHVLAAIVQWRCEI